MVIRLDTLILSLGLCFQLIVELSVLILFVFILDDLSYEGRGTHTVRPHLDVPFRVHNLRLFR
jgi:hypothetical protein